MAMNKKEQAAFDAAIEDAEINRALRWSDYESGKDVPVPSYEDGYVNGWSYNSYSGNVFKSWSRSVVHGDGHMSDGENHINESQKGIAQYSTELKAIQAMRREMELSFAKRLADVDRRIRNARAEDKS